MPETRLITSAEHLKGDNPIARFTATAAPWQPESWRLYSEVGEYKSATKWIANGLSQMTIDGKMWNGDEWVDDTNPVAAAARQRLGDQAELFRKWGENSVVAGEIMLVQSGSRWMARSRSEILSNDRGFYLNEYGNGAGRSRKGRNGGVLGDPISDLWRIFHPHAQYSMMPDTPTSSFLIDLEQLRLLRAVLNSKLSTRLWMNGVWVFGQKVSLPSQNAAGTPGGQSAFLAKLTDTLKTSMRRKNTASDVMPILMQVTTPEVGDVVKQFYPESAIDEREAALRTEIRTTLRELLDLPVEMQTSMSNTNHWGSWSITEINLRYHLLPRAKALLDAISLSWYQDQLISAGMAPEEAVLHKLVPNISNLEGEASSDEARQAHDRVMVKDSYVRGRSRIPEEAAPTEAEYVQILGRQLNDPYLATFGMDIASQIDWEKVGGTAGAKGVGADAPQRAPGVGDPGSPSDPNSEVQPPK